tara:strand:- start:3190 stop:3432 length:243 start_codon:yes stop_codon:yes gene_type:complete
MSPNLKRDLEIGKLQVVESFVTDIDIITKEYRDHNLLNTSAIACEYNLCSGRILEITRKYIRARKRELNAKAREYDKFCV